MHLLALALAAIMVVCDCLPQPPVANPSPIVLIPGLMGSQLEVMDHTDTRCRTKDKVTLWVSGRIILKKRCVREELVLKYDSDTRSFDNNTNVEIIVPGFGETSTVEFICNIPLKRFIAPCKYFHNFVKYFVDRGYERGRTIRAAPYDWRLAADELEKRGYFHRLKSLIEDMYTSSGHTKVTVVAHSMGGLVSLHFLTAFSGIDQAWKDKHIHAYIPLAGAWSGGVSSLDPLTSGILSSPPVLHFRRFVTHIARTFESIPWLLPRASVFGDDVLVSTPSKNYTAHDYKELFTAIGYTNGYEFLQNVQALNSNFPAPNVPTFCLYGNKVRTPKSFNWKKDFDQYRSLAGKQAHISYGDGDGTVNIESLRVCLRWAGMMLSPFDYQVFEHVEHNDIIRKPHVLKYIAEIVGAPTGKVRGRGLSSWIKRKLG